MVVWKVWLCSVVPLPLHVVERGKEGEGSVGLSASQSVLFLRLQIPFNNTFGFCAGCFQVVVGHYVVKLIPEG